MVGRVVPLATSEQALAAATEAFLAQPSLARSTRRSYDQTLTRLVRELGSDRPLSTLTVEAITVAVTTAWGWAGAGDLEPPGGHRPLVPGVLPPAALAGRGPHR
jgi:hypothetical protein